MREYETVRFVSIIVIFLLCSVFAPVFSGIRANVSGGGGFSVGGESASAAVGTVAGFFNRTECVGGMVAGAPAIGEANLFGVRASGFLAKAIRRIARILAAEVAAAFGVVAIGLRKRIRNAGESGVFVFPNAG